MAEHPRRGSEGAVPSTASCSSGGRPRPSRQQSMEFLNIRCDVMVNWLYQQQIARSWCSGPREGIMIKKARASYSCCPEELRSYASEFVAAVETMNVAAAMTVNTSIIPLLLRRDGLRALPLSNGGQLQVLPDYSYLPRCRLHHFAAFITDVQLLVVWDDDSRNLLRRVTELDEQMLRMTWTEEVPFDAIAQTPVLSSSASTGEFDTGSPELAEDVEKADPYESRPRVLLNSITVALSITVLIAALGAGWRNLALELLSDGDYTRLALLITVPLQTFVSLFFFQAITGNLCAMLGPIAQVHINSKFYSGKPPKRISHGTLPHVTIQCPVYKEGLASVIKPTVMSVKAAISTYELQGGSANIFINDDGMQLLSLDQAQERQEFYDEHNIGWVARPAHNPKPDDESQSFLRRGKFKKASNMNFALMISNKVEERLSSVQRSDKWTSDDEMGVYRKSLEEVVAEDTRAWAAGNIRMGDYVLLSEIVLAPIGHTLLPRTNNQVVDSDTRIPVDCLLDAVSEMEASPECAILQYSSGVMQVVHNFFENGITFFTNLVYTAIRVAVANGDVAPFVGHNAILRWSAVQEVSYTDEDGYEKFWSESHVSEDFDISLRLQTIGYTIRLGAYTGEGFKEGVSLTVYDELARWEKYAYGCNELLFHPIRHWIFKGPFTPLFRRFITSNMPLPSKLTILAYIGTYYAIGCAWPLTVANYFLMGWFPGALDKFYVDSFRIYLSIIVVFTAMGNVALAVLRYRTTEKTLFGSFFECMKWVPLLMIFLGGISMHVSQALLSHMFGVDMSWGATAKEVENTTFFKEVPKLFRKFKWTFAFCLLAVAVMIVCASDALPVFWRIDTFVAIYPLSSIVVAHVLLPIVLNPSLMLLTW